MTSAEGRCLRTEAPRCPLFRFFPYKLQRGPSPSFQFTNPVVGRVQTAIRLCNEFLISDILFSFPECPEHVSTEGLPVCFCSWDLRQGTLLP